MVEDASRRWLTYSEVAQAFGLPSAKAGESKARRAKWERQLGNDRLARAAVPLSVLETLKPRRTPYDAPTTSPLTEALLAEITSAHQAAITMVESRLAEAERQLAELPTLREAVGSATGEAKALRESLDHERQARERERSAAEKERAGLMAQIAELKPTPSPAPIWRGLMKRWLRR